MLYDFFIDVLKSTIIWSLAVLVVAGLFYGYKLLTIHKTQNDKNRRESSCSQLHLRLQQVRNLMHGKTIEMQNFSRLQRWRRTEPRDARERDRSLAGKDRIRARKAANKQS